MFRLKRKYSNYFWIITIIAFALVPLTADAKKKKDRVKRDFRYADIDHNDELSREEWNRRGNFDLIDSNNDGAISLQELRDMYAGHDNRYYSWPLSDELIDRIEIDASVATDRVAVNTVTQENICGFVRKASGCRFEDQVKRGLFPTGTGPKFPENTICSGIDDYWAMSYKHKRNVNLNHGGIDIPVPWGTPIRASAAGSVVAIFEANMSKRGIEVALRHSPEQTGLPMWTYTTYGHLDKMPDLKIGQKVAMGQIIGPTGNSGLSSRKKKQSRNRRPAVHFAAFYSDNPHYVVVKDVLVPLDGYWLDPMMFFRQTGPFDTNSVKALPESEKFVDIPVSIASSNHIPNNTKITWPYRCEFK